MERTFPTTTKRTEKKHQQNYISFWKSLKKWPKWKLFKEHLKFERAPKLILVESKAFFWHNHYALPPRREYKYTLLLWQNLYAE